MSTITKEQLRERARQKVKSLELAVTQTAFADSRAELEEELELARIALASLEAEPVCVIDQSNLDYLKSGSDADVWPASRAEMGDVLLYRSATPAPVSVPDESAIFDAAIDICRKSDAIDEHAWNHGVLAVMSAFSDCRAAMLKHSEPFIVTSDHRMMEMPQVEAINAVTAMLQGADGNAPAHFRSRPAQSSISPAQGGNSPVIPDGWVLVPEEPTHEMLEAGDEQFGTYDVYRRMIAAAPQQEVTQALAKGMERYGDAMQKLADGGD